MEDFENNTAFAKYADFSISPNAVSAEEDGYSLYVAGFEDGGAGIPLLMDQGGNVGGKAGLALPSWSLTPSWCPLHTPGLEGSWLAPNQLGPQPWGEATPTPLQTSQGAAISLYCSCTAPQHLAQEGFPILPG